MGTTLGVLFILAAAAIGIGVGLRPTLIDGRRIAAEIAKQVDGEAECDREIRLGAAGAEFECVISQGGAMQRIELTMDRNGNYAPRTPARRGWE